MPDHQSLYGRTILAADEQQHLTRQHSNDISTTNSLDSFSFGTGTEIIFSRHRNLWHTEHHVVLKGRLIITQDDVTRVLTPEDGVCIAPAGVVHSIKSYLGEEGIFEEIAIPDEARGLFFCCLFAPGVIKSPLRVMQVFYHGDGYELQFGIRRLEWLFVVVVGGLIAPLLGYKVPDKRLRMDPGRFPPSKKN
ncbi:hypothetical protein FB451DRAFT_1508537 [Mycena latifolia]|nr:hypothetical protein FB451DRAFT_1508537 [Mycena latifolia]